jgi:hypothetical protein
MAKMSLQFHGLPVEIIEFAEGCMKEFNLQVAAMKFFPNFQIMLANSSSIKDCLDELDKIDRICFLNNEPNLSVGSAQEFMEKNPDSLALTIGGYNDEGLEESILAAKTNDSMSLKIWRKIIKKLKALTNEGAWVVNPHTNAKLFSKKHRYTNGAKKISKEGVKIRPIAGWNYFILNSES